MITLAFYLDGGGANIGAAQQVSKEQPPPHKNVCIRDEWKIAQSARKVTLIPIHAAWGSWSVSDAIYPSTALHWTVLLSLGSNLPIFCRTGPTKPKLLIAAPLGYWTCSMKQIPSTSFKASEPSFLIMKRFPSAIHRESSEGIALLNGSGNRGSTIIDTLLIKLGRPSANVTTIPAIESATP